MVHPTMVGVRARRCLNSSGGLAFDNNASRPTTQKARFHRDFSHINKHAFGERLGQEAPQKRVAFAGPDLLRQFVKKISPIPMKERRDIDGKLAVGSAMNASAMKIALPSLSSPQCKPPKDFAVERAAKVVWS
jgi:hypothetical protein